MQGTARQEGAWDRPAAASVDRRLCVAPMMKCTDRHGRAFLRCATRRTMLYSEMTVAEAALRGDRRRLLGFDQLERPLALQLAGSCPRTLAEAARVAQDLGYDEVNLNVGCPSNRAGAGRFGACLMADPDLVARCLDAMCRAVSIPVTVKCRTGIDDMNDGESLQAFIATIAASGCASVAVHARKAWLAGLSPQQNRNVPPLRWDLVHAAKRLFPGTEIVLNGGIADLAAARGQLGRVDGVMIGRAAYRTPHILAEADRLVFGDARPAPTRREVAAAWLPYLERKLARGVPLHRMVRHMQGLCHGLPGARSWRRHLTVNAIRPGAGPEVVEQALGLVDNSG